jgi:hypothetical protein
MVRRFSAASPLPLTLALQGVAFTLIALFSFSGAPPGSDRVGSGDLAKPDTPAAAEIQIPRDLARERLPVPKFPQLEKPGEEQAPVPDSTGPKAPIVAGEKLAALRVSSVALAGLVTMDSPTPIPDAPDVLGLHEFGGRSGRSWLGGTERTSRGSGGFLGPSDIGDEGSGWGGSGWGGIGRGRGGHGDNCIPGRGGLIRRPPTPGGTTAGPVGGPVVSGSGGGGERGRPARGDRPARSGSRR